MPWDSLLAIDFARLGQDELLALTRGLEAQRRRLPVVEHAALAELVDKRFPREHR